MKPIIMSTEDVQGILDGRKTMARTPIKPQPEFAQVHVWDGKVLYEGENRTWCWKQRVSPDCWNGIDWLEQFAPYRPGDVLYVRETWKVDASDYDKDGYVYKADGSIEKYPNNLLLWRSPISMPREAARLFLRVKDVRVERVQDISPEDCESEGYFEAEPVEPRPRSWFSAVWDARNAKRGYGWGSNPWVWVIAFECVEKGAES